MAELLDLQLGTSAEIRGRNLFLGEGVRWEQAKSTCEQTLRDAKGVPARRGEVFKTGSEASSLFHLPPPQFGLPSPLRIPVS